MQQYQPVPVTISIGFRKNIHSNAQTKSINASLLCDVTNQMDAFSLCEHNSRLITSCELCERIPLPLCLSPSLSASMDFSNSLRYRLNAVSIMQSRERFVLVAERVATTGVVLHINRCTDQQPCIMNVITHIKRQHIQTVRVGPWSQCM